ncbi:MAG: exonuclease SbcCD subunit D, partial [Bacteroidales bacterium]
WLAETIVSHNIDALVIAGDLYDSPNPSALSQHLFFDFIRRIKKENPGLQVVATSGNHDSGARLEAPDPLLGAFDVHVRGTIRRTVDEIDYDSLLIPLYNATNRTKPAGYCLAVPYLRQGDYPPCTEENVTNRYAWGINRFYQILFEKAEALRTPDQFLLAMGHLQTIGAELSAEDTSERTIIGGMEALSASMFDGAGYVALGHIHKPQRVSGREFVRYSGSPLPMSFAEINYKHGVQLIEFEGSTLVRNERILFEAPVKLMSVPSIPKMKDELLSTLEVLQLAETDPQRAPYLEVKVMIDRPEPNLRFEVEKVLAEKNVRLAKITIVTPDSLSTTEKRQISVDAAPLSPSELANQVWTSRFGTTMPSELEELFHEAATINKD